MVEHIAMEHLAVEHLAIEYLAVEFPSAEKHYTHDKAQDEQSWSAKIPW